MPADVVEPLRGFRFVVGVPNSANIYGIGGDGIDLGFQRVSGLQAEVGVYEWEEISDPVTSRKLIDSVKLSDLVLERGVTANRTGLSRWYDAVVYALQYPSKQITYRSDVYVYAQEKGGSSFSLTRLWVIYDAFPKVIKFGDLDATQSAVQIESLTLAHEGLRYF